MVTPAPSKPQTELQILQGGGVLNNAVAIQQKQQQQASPTPQASTPKNFNPAAGESQSAFSVLMDSGTPAKAEPENNGTVVQNGRLIRYKGLPAYIPGETWNFGNNVKVVAENNGYQIYVYNTPRQWTIGKSAAFQAAQNFQSNLPKYTPTSYTPSSGILSAPSGIQSNVGSNAKTLKQMNTLNTDVTSIINQVGVNVNSLSNLAGKIQAQEKFYQNHPSDYGMRQVINGEIATYNKDLNTFNF